MSAVFTNYNEKLTKIMGIMDVVQYIKDRHIPDKQLLQMLANISIVTQGHVFIDGCETFRKSKLFMSLLDMALDREFEEASSEEKQPIVYTHKVVFTGFRDKALQAKCASIGIEVVDAITKSVHFLVVLDKSSTSTKMEKAKKDGISILSKEEFMARFNL